ncbi:MAG: two-component regulator propeller domain-containing protein, partial [Saprospiraceae bacterium]
MIIRRYKIGSLFLMNICSLFFFLTGSVLSQSSHSLPNIQFYQLNTVHGLTDNYIYDMAMDKNGFLWVGTGEGLNEFNGKSVIKYFKQEYPQLQNDYIKEILCDRKNRMWVLTNPGDVTMIDERRKFHRIGIYNESKFIPTRWMLQTDSQDIILLTKKNHLVIKPDVEVESSDSLTLDDFEPLEVQHADSLYTRGYLQVFKYDGDTYFFVTDDHILRVNYKTQTLENVIECKDATLLTKWNDNEILLYHKTEHQLKSLHLDDGQYSFPFANIRDQKGNLISTEITQ